MNRKIGLFLLTYIVAGRLALQASSFDNICAFLTANAGFKFGSEITAVHESGVRSRGLFLGRIPNSKRSMVGLENGLIVYLNSSDVEFHDKSGRLLETSPEIDQTPSHKLQWTTNCVVLSTYNCLSYLRHIGLIDVWGDQTNQDPFDDNILRNLNVALSSSLDRLRFKAWNLVASLLARKTVGIEYQTRHRVKMLLELGVSSKITSDPHELMQHVDAGRPAILEVVTATESGAFRFYNQTTGTGGAYDREIPVSISSQAEEDELIGRTGPLGCHSVLIIGHGLGHYVVADSNDSSLLLWKEEWVHRGIIPSKVGFIGPWSFKITSAATLVAPR